VSSRAFFRGDAQTLTFTTGPGDAEHTFSLDAIGAISSLRSDDGEILMTAGRADDPPPNPTADRRGDLRLFRARLGETAWEEVYPGYAHDPVRLPDGYAVHGGAGITVLDDAGNVVHETKIGRFDWGPPSLSVNPAGDRIAWASWRSDERKLTVQRPLDDKPRTFPHSCYGYAWLDDETLVYYLGGPLRLLDVETGKTRQLLKVEGEDAKIDHVQVVGDRVWFAAFVPGGFFERRRGTLRHVALDGSDEQVVYEVPKAELLRNFVAFPDGSAWIRTERFRRMTIVERPIHTIGPLTQFLQTWQPLHTSGEPEFAFHALS
jgi:hypothetical protein